MAGKDKKTEHSGPKKGSGAYWGRKKDAKKDSNKSRRDHDKRAAKKGLDEQNLKPDQLFKIVSHLKKTGAIQRISDVKSFLADKAGIHISPADATKIHRLATESFELDTNAVLEETFGKEQLEAYQSQATEKIADAMDELQDAMDFLNMADEQGAAGKISVLINELDGIQSSVIGNNPFYQESVNPLDTDAVIKEAMNEGRRGFTRGIDWDYDMNSHMRREVRIHSPEVLARQLLDFVVDPADVTDEQAFGLAQFIVDKHKGETLQVYDLERLVRKYRIHNNGQG